MGVWSGVVEWVEGGYIAWAWWANAIYFIGSLLWLASSSSYLVGMDQTALYAGQEFERERERDREREREKK
jgi:hypothetical protein